MNTMKQTNRTLVSINSGNRYLNGNIAFGRITISFQLHVVLALSNLKNFVDSLFNNGSQIPKEKESSTARDCASG